MLMGKLHKLVTVGFMAVVLSSCENTSIANCVPSHELTDILDSYCENFDHAIQTIDNAYGVCLTMHDPMAIIREKQTLFPVAEELFTIDEKKISGPNSDNFSPYDKSKIVFDIYFNESDGLNIRVRFVLLNELNTIVVTVCNLTGSSLSLEFFRTCQYSISIDDGESLVETVNNCLETANNDTMASNMLRENSENF